ncbi:MAG: carbohydrate kinase family protein [Candidatus Hydrogenedentes bacterium]|nr:carbohydrate kinase family protein [Candidatus Hydrogenedentota bacterium]
MKFDLLSLGLACADVMVRPVESLPERGKLALVPHLEIHLGGLAAVTASVFSALGGSAAFIGALGRDGFGDYVHGALAGSGVNVDQVKRGNGEGTAATVVMVSEDGERTFLHHAGCSQSLREGDVDFEFFTQGRHLHWGGPAVTPSLDGEPIGRVLKKAHELGLTTSMDTCYDGGGRWLSRIEHALPHLDIVMSSLEEARMYTGKQDPEEIADFYCGYGPVIALIKLGERGLFVKQGEEKHYLPAHNVEVQDTTGAGDAACGGFLFGYLKGWSVYESARLANAVGALTVQAMGGSEGVRSFEETVAFMNSAAVR